MEIDIKGVWVVVAGDMEGYGIRGIYMERNEAVKCAHRYMRHEMGIDGEERRTEYRIDPTRFNHNELLFEEWYHDSWLFGKRNRMVKGYNYVWMYYRPFDDPQLHEEGWHNPNEYWLEYENWSEFKPDAEESRDAAA